MTSVIPLRCSWVPLEENVTHKQRNSFHCQNWYNLESETLTISWPAGHICPTYKESFQVRWDNSIPLFLHAAIYLEVSLFRWTSQNAYCVQCCMQHCTQYHGCFAGKCILTGSTMHTVCNAACSIAHGITAVSQENAFWLVQRNRDTSR